LTVGAIGLRAYEMMWYGATETKMELVMLPSCAMAIQVNATEGVQFQVVDEESGGSSLSPAESRG